MCSDWWAPGVLLHSPDAGKQLAGSGGQGRGLAPRHLGGRPRVCETMGQDEVAVEVRVGREEESSKDRAWRLPCQRTRALGGSSRWTGKERWSDGKASGEGVSRKPGEGGVSKPRPDVSARRLRVAHWLYDLAVVTVTLAAVFLE